MEEKVKTTKRRVCGESAVLMIIALSWPNLECAPLVVISNSTNKNRRVLLLTAMARLSLFALLAFALAGIAQGNPVDQQRQLGDPVHINDGWEYAVCG